MRLITGEYGIMISSLRIKLFHTKNVSLQAFTSYILLHTDPDNFYRH